MIAQNRAVVKRIKNYELRIAGAGVAFPFRFARISAGDRRATLQVALPPHSQNVGAVVLRREKRRGFLQPAPFPKQKTACESGLCLVSNPII